jgi:hypothetical protein
MLTERLDALEKKVRVLQKTQQAAPSYSAHGCGVSHKETSGMQQEGAASDKVHVTICRGLCRTSLLVI